MSMASAVLCTCCGGDTCLVTLFDFPVMTTGAKTPIAGAFDYGGTWTLTVNSIDTAPGDWNESHPIDTLTGPRINVTVSNGTTSRTTDCRLWLEVECPDHVNDAEDPYTIVRVWLRDEDTTIGPWGGATDYKLVLIYQAYVFYDGTSYGPTENAIIAGELHQSRPDLCGEAQGARDLDSGYRLVYRVEGSAATTAACCVEPKWGAQNCGFCIDPCASGTIDISFTLDGVDGISGYSGYDGTYTVSLSERVAIETVSSCENDLYLTGSGLVDGDLEWLAPDGRLTCEIYDEDLSECVDSYTFIASATLKISRGGIVPADYVIVSINWVGTRDGLSGSAVNADVISYSVQGTAFGGGLFDLVYYGATVTDATADMTVTTESTLVDGECYKYGPCCRNNAHMVDSEEGTIDLEIAKDSPGNWSGGGGLMDIYTLLITFDAGVWTATLWTGAVGVSDSFVWTAAGPESCPPDTGWEGVETLATLELQCL